MSEQPLNQREESPESKTAPCKSDKKSETDIDQERSVALSVFY